MEVLYLDNHLLVVAKPAGLLVQGDSTGDPTLLEQARAFIKQRFDKPGNVFVGLVHRLDRPVSGVVVLARTSKSAARLTRQFKDRTVAKTYLACTWGLPSGDGTCRDHLAKRGRHVRVVSAGSPGAKDAVTRWEAIGMQQQQALLAVHPETGRAHQIRVQLAARGAPILGDYRYGPERPFDGASIALHCYAVGITHPTKKEPMTFEVPPPAAWPAWTRTVIDAWRARS